MQEVYIVELRDKRLMDGRHPLAVCASEAAAMQAAEGHFMRERRAAARWERPTNRGPIVAVLRAGYSKEYEVWRFNLIDSVEPERAPTREDIPRLLTEAQERAHQHEGQ